MLRTAICDDDLVFSCRLEEMLSEAVSDMGMQAEIETFGDGSTLLEAFSIKNRYDIIFMDIEMEKMDGISTARRIRQMDRNVLLIYITCYEQRFRELFEVEAFRFLSKPVNQKILYRYLQEAYERINEKNELFQYTYRKETHKVAVSDIVYFESRYRVLHIFLKDGTEDIFYGRLGQIEDFFRQRHIRFIRPHQSYLVNYDYIKTSGVSSVVINTVNGEKALPISNDRKKTMREQLISFTCGRGE